MLWLWPEVVLHAGDSAWHTTGRFTHNVPWKEFRCKNLVLQAWLPYKLAGNACHRKAKGLLRSQAEAKGGASHKKTHTTGCCKHGSGCMLRWCFHVSGCLKVTLRYLNESEHINASPAAYVHMLHMICTYVHMLRGRRWPIALHSV